LMRLVDTHAHLDQITHLAQALERARRVGVDAIIAVGTNLESSLKTLEIAEEHQGLVYPAVGIHPWDVEAEGEEALEHIEAHVGECIAIGEIGLDYWIKTDQKRQMNIFRRQLEIAERARKPVLVHSRGAWEECYTTIREFGLQHAVFHWYSGPVDVLDMIVESGYLISATPAAEYSRHLRRAVAHAPISSLLLETDSPVKYEGKESEPADVFRSLKAVAELKATPVEEIAEETTKNAVKLFGLNLV